MMRLARGGFALFTFSSVLFAQPSAQKPAPGLQTDWEIGAILKEISAHADRLLPMLEKIDATAWIAKGASETYAAQLQDSKDQVRALAAQAKALAANPEKLSASLELLFRVQGLETMLASLGEAIRKYQSPSDAQALAALVAQNGANRDRFQRYVVNLAAAREQELQVMDREAQRCRGVVTQAPTRAVRKK